MPLEAVVAVDVDEAETIGVAVSPLEVIQQRPGEVPAHVRTQAAAQALVNYYHCVACTLTLEKIIVCRHGKISAPKVGFSLLY